LSLAGYCSVLVSVGAMNGGNLILQSPYSADGIARHSENMNSTQSHERSRHENLPERSCPYGGAEKATIYSTPRYRNSDSGVRVDGCSLHDSELRCPQHGPQESPIKLSDSCHFNATPVLAHADSLHDHLPRTHVSV
jgi:hypothetical protein